eukprot:12792134-Alexandrium_andersonii.AAC.1
MPPVSADSGSPGAGGAPAEGRAGDAGGLEATRVSLLGRARRKRGLGFSRSRIQNGGRTPKLSAIKRGA